jgi:hypothetical protein
MSRENIHSLLLILAGKFDLDVESRLLNLAFKDDVREVTIVHVVRMNCIRSLNVKADTLKKSRFRDWRERQITFRSPP